MAARDALALGVALALLCVTMSADAERLRAVTRLAQPADAGWRSIAAIANDTRDVLFGYSEATAEVRSIRTGRHKTFIRASLAGSLANSKRVVVMPTLVIRGRRTALVPISRAVQRDAAGRYVDVELGFAVDLKQARVTLRARAEPDSLTSSHETGPLEIPEGATLEVAFGLLDTGSAQGAATFRVLACASDDCKPIHSSRLAQTRQGRWENRTLALSSFAGRKISFRFTTQSKKEGRSPTPPFPVWAIPKLYAPAPSPASEHNVLMISVDTLGARHLGAYGYARDTSPFIDSVLEPGGSIFERCFTTATTTGPSHMSMFTGLEPSVHGVYGLYGGLGPNRTTLASVFQAHGFATAAFTDNGPLAARRGFHRGFDSYEENKSSAFGSGERHVARTFRKGLAWLRRNHDKRFFLFLHTFEVHAPYAAPAEYQTLFAADGLDDGRTRVPDEWSAVRYDREIRYLDDELRQFFGELDKEDLLEDTIVVFVSDHGEEFGEHGQLYHGGGVYDEVLRVPLIVIGPGVAKQRVRTPVSLLDLMPTVLELAGVSTEATGHGSSFARLLREGAGDRTRSDARLIFSEAWSQNVVRLVGPGKVARDSVPVPVLVAQHGAEKIIRYLGAEGPIYTYFDLAVDPAERVDRYDPSVERVRWLQRAIDDYAERMHAPDRSALGRAPDESPDRLDPDRSEKLRALGYIE